MFIGEQSVEGSEKGRLGYDDFVEGAGLDLGACGPQRPVEGCGQRVEVNTREQIVGLLGVTACDAVPVTGRDPGLVGQDAFGTDCGVADARQFQHVFEVTQVGGADLRELLLAVIRLVGQPDPALHQGDEVTVGVSLVGADIHSEHSGNARTLDGPERGNETGNVCHLVDKCEVGSQRFGSQCFDSFDIHETRVQVADLALFIVQGVGSTRFDDRAHLGFGFVEKIHE